MAVLDTSPPPTGAISRTLPKTHQQWDNVRNSVTVELGKEEFNSVIERLGHGPTRTDYSIVCEHVAQKIGMEKAVRITYEENGLICFNFVPNIDQFLREHYRELMGS